MRGSAIRSRDARHLKSTGKLEAHPQPQPHAPEAEHAWTLSIDRTHNSHLTTPNATQNQSTDLYLSECEYCTRQYMSCALARACNTG